MELHLYICTPPPFLVFIKMKLRSHSIVDDRRQTRSQSKKKKKLISKEPIRRTQRKKSPKPLITSTPDPISSTSQNSPNSSNPLVFFATTVLDYKSISYEKTNKPKPMEEIDQERGVCEENLMVEILSQMNNDPIGYKGSISTMKKTLGPDLNLPVEDEEEATGDNCVAGEFNEPTIAAGEPRFTLNFNPRPLGDASAVDFIPSIATTSSPVDPSTAAGEPTRVAAGEVDPCPKSTPALCSFAHDTLKVNTNPTRSIDNRSLVSPSPSICPIPAIETTAATTSGVVPTFLVNKTNDVSRPQNRDTMDSPTLFPETHSQVFSQDQIDHMRVILQNSVTRNGGMGTFAGTGITCAQDHTNGSNLRQSVQNYVHFGQLNSFSTMSQSLRPFEPQHSVWNHSSRNNQSKPITTPNHPHDPTGRVEFDLVKMFAQAKEQIHDPTPLTTVFPLGLKPKDDLLGVHKRQRTEPKSGPVLKPTWKPVRGKHVASGRSSCMIGTKGKEPEQPEKMEKEKEDGMTPTPKGVGQV